MSDRKNDPHRARAWYNMKKFLDHNPGMCQYFDMEYFMSQEPDKPDEYTPGMRDGVQWKDAGELVQCADGVYRPANKPTWFDESGPVTKAMWDLASGPDQTVAVRTWADADGTLRYEPISETELYK